MLIVGAQERLFHDRLLQRLRGGATGDGPTRTIQEVYKTVTRGGPRDY